MHTVRERAQPLPVRRHVITRLQLFEESKDITPSTERPVVCSTTAKLIQQSEPSYSIPFAFTFPSSSTGCPCQLPPSLYRDSPVLRVRVEYAIIITVHYNTTICRVKRLRKVQRELPFRSEPGVVFLQASAVGCLPASKLCPKMDDRLRQADKEGSSSQSWLPLYSPSLQIEFGLPSPPVLTTRRATPVRLVLHVPAELLEGDSIYLRSVTVHLKSSVAAVAGKISGSSTETAHCWSSGGRIPIDKEHFELESGVWGALTVFNALPTCTSCMLDLTHEVEVTAGISRGDSEEIQVRVSLVKQWRRASSAIGTNPTVACMYIAQCPGDGSATRVRLRHSFRHSCTNRCCCDGASRGELGHGRFSVLCCFRCTSWKGLRSRAI